ncbi:MerR family transcriptional regulator [Sporolactobacillus shoreae]|uniref:MerR family transcriptional regulator n=1 Tax=Sporolactobacillus shoreae TaxID=1465501 RepID=A0A4Z0GJV3_9BACL|nr:MerR family transcriptional regulator [Sporolactobacillus shoreae]TGA96270.1 MerR family transcriptional regulator [Sporolactobacillus shoreae]
MYKIGQFSKITNLTIKALRYYDEQNLLNPSYRNEENGYRYYNDSDFQKAQFILLLRSLEFSISEMKDVLNHCEMADDLSYFLEEKKILIERQILKEQALVEEISQSTAPKKAIAASHDYQIVIRTIEPMTVASMRYQGSYSDIGDYICRIYDVLKDNVKGQPICCYYDPDYSEIADIEVCVPIIRPVSARDLVIRELPAIKAICTTHKGPYEHLNQAYKAMIDYAIRENLLCGIPSRTVFLKGPGRIFTGNPNHFITEVMIPINGDA